MMNVDLFWGLAFFSCATLGVLFWLWMRKRPVSGKVNLEKQFVWLCSICAYTYITTKEEKISKCPRCTNFNKKEV
jgi:hypothetical protein